LYDFLYREHSPVQGRWLSPDPAGMAAANPADPQTWNRYAYVEGYTPQIRIPLPV
jgi:RHS repeat-associated protein